MDELIDILDEHGNFTGETCLKSIAHKFGYFHPTIHIWLYTKNHQVLLQKRALTKKVFPGLWDISVAGHIAAGEQIEKAAIREIFEEIGYKITTNDLHKIGTRKHMVKHNNGIIDNEFHHVYIAELTQNISSLVIQEEEVDAIKLFDLSILLETEKHTNVLLPQFKDYYQSVYNKIIQHLS